MVLGLVGCSNPGTSQPDGAPARLIFSHEDGGEDVSPGLPVTVEVVDGTLAQVSLSDNLGEVAGDFDTDLTSWHNTEDLNYGKTYTLTVSSLGTDGEPVEETRTFTTLSVPQGQYWGVTLISTRPGLPYSTTLDGKVWGVGQPIVARFDEPVDPAVAQAAIVVKTSTPVEGSWSWVNDREMHWRPRSYWPAGTRVTVEANILGVKLTSPDGGRTLYGRENVTAAFTIGRSTIAKIDNSTHLLTVWVDGVQVPVVNGRGCDYSGSERFGCVDGKQLAIRVSMGKDNQTQDINGHWHNWRTYSGIHVVTTKSDPQLMTASLPTDDPGYYEAEVVPHAVRITDDGNFVHAADWSIDDQGYRNVSHGCINIDPADALWFYNLFNPGDVVEIVGTGRPFPDRGEGLPDWNTTWDQWVAGSAATHGSAGQE